MLQTSHKYLNPPTAGGVSAHLNLLCPFTTNLSMGDNNALIDISRDFGRFHIDFTSTDWFSTDSMHLMSSEATALTNLVARTCEVFPEYPAFGAVPERTVPHITIGKCAPLPELRATKTEVLSKLPIHQVCATAELWSGPPPETGR